MPADDADDRHEADLPPPDLTTVSMQDLADEMLKRFASALVVYEQLPPQGSREMAVFGYTYKGLPSSALGLAEYARHSLLSDIRIVEREESEPDDDEPDWSTNTS